MSTKSHIEKKVGHPKQHFRTSSLVVGKSLGVEEGAYFNHIAELAGITPQRILMLHKLAAITGDWGTLTGSATFTPSSVTTAGPTNARVCVAMTAGTTTGGEILLTASPILPVDLRPYRYIGMWYQASASLSFVAGDVKLTLYGWGNTSASSAPEKYATVNFPAFTEAATPVWKYLLLDISGVNERLLEKITQVGFLNSNMANAKFLRFFSMEAFYWAYNDYAISGIYKASGPARGLIMRLPVEPGTTIRSGDSLYYTGNGYVAPISNGVTGQAQGQFFAGVALEAANASAPSVDGSVFVRVVVDGIVNRLCTDAVNNGTLEEDAVIVDATSGYAVEGADGASIWRHIGVARTYTPSTAGDVIPVLIKRGTGYNL